MVSKSGKNDKGAIGVVESKYGQWHIREDNSLIDGKLLIHILGVSKSEGWSHPSTPLVFVVGAWVNAL